MTDRNFPKPEANPLLDNIRIVLVEPQGPLNIGSTCRAMNNFGLHNLCLVRPGCELDSDAVKMAMHSQDILNNAKVFQTIPESTRAAAPAFSPTTSPRRSFRIGGKSHDLQA